MNLKKTLMSMAGAAALVGSMLAPVYAQDTSQVVTSNVGEDGELTYGFTGTNNAITFNVSVDTNTSADSGPVYRGFAFNDSHSYSPGFDLQISASDFTTTAGAYTIDNENLTVGKRAPQPGSTDFCKLNDTETPVGGNDFQTISVLGTHVPATTPLSGNVSVIHGTSGRGCGDATVGVSYFLHVPAGTFTGSTNATFTTDLMLSNVMAPVVLGD